jgi:hypothetical protein
MYPIPSSVHTELREQDRLVIALADYCGVDMKDEDEAAGIHRIIKRLTEPQKRLFLNVDDLLWGSGKKMGPWIHVPVIRTQSDLDRVQITRSDYDDATQVKVNP